MSEVFLIGGVRTALGRYGGVLAGVRPDDMAALVIVEAMRRANVEGSFIDEVILGAANQAGEDNRNVARMAALLAGLPDSVPGYTVNRLCASGLTAVASAAQAVRSGEADLIIAGGVESMTRAPWVLSKPGAAWSRPGEIFDTSLGWRFVNPSFREHDDKVGSTGSPVERKITMTMGETAEEIAVLEKITREECDNFAFHSHAKAIAAIDSGRFADEIVPVKTKNGDVVIDEGPRRDTTLEKLGSLKPLFRAGGIVTAGSSSPLSDGAAAIVVASEQAVERYGLVPRARVVVSASAGVAPNLMGLGPVPATLKALSKVGWSTEDIGSIELNEAFAAQSLGVIRQLKLDTERVNSDGGAIALGHPLGCSGARILVTLLGRMEREATSRGLAALCVGVGQGVAMLVERV
jgi:acetyl-CoA acetyltransferase family protein